MSFLYYNDQDPKTDANFRDVRAKNFWQWNHATEAYERVGAGGGSGEVPYWVQENSARIGLTDAYKTVLTDRDMEVVNNDVQTSSLLEADALTLGEVGVNHRLDAGSIDAANSLRDVAAGTSGKMLLYDTTTKKLSHTNPPAPLPVWAKADSIEINKNGAVYPGTYLTDGSFLMRDGTYMTRVHPNSIYVGSENASGAMSAFHPFTQVSRIGINFSEPGNTVWITPPIAKTLKNIHDAVEGAPGVGSKMIVRETDGTYRRADVPAAATLPAWVKPSTAEFAGVNTDVSLGGRQLVYRNRVSTRATFVDDASLTVGEITTSGLLDASKPFVAIRTGNITFRDDSGNSNALLTSDDARVLSGIRVAAQAEPSANGRMLVWEPNGTYRRAPLPAGAVSLPKTYYLPIPSYTGSGGAVGGTSYFPRWSSTTPSGAFWAVVTPIQRRFKLAADDTLLLKSQAGPTLNPSLYFNTWYAIAFSPSAGFAHDASRMAVLGSVLKTEFPSGTPAEDTVEVSIDIRPAPYTAVDGSIAFRINGQVLTTSGAAATPDPIKMKLPSDPFFGVISFKILTYNADLNLPEAVTLTP